MIIEAMEDHSQPHVLVVDDDLIMRGAAREYLTEAGFLVSEAENGVQALQALENLRPDIILMDVMMPEMDGFATANAVRHLPGCEGVPILIMTALDDLGSINRAYEVGATDFITKPINWVILVQRVRYMTRAVRMMNEQKRLEKELQQAQKLGAVATLAGGVAHDFNNLLQSIQGFSEVLLFGKNKDDPSFPVLKRIMAAVNRGGVLTRQLLTYSRKIKSEKRPINLNNHVRQAHQLLQSTIPKMIEIELRLEEGLKMVNADSVQMEQVLMNLAINARDAMPDGGRLVIETANVRLPEKLNETRSGSTSREGVLISVSDTGHGMDKAILEQIFEPFFSTKAPGKGTGLGLSMVHGIVKNHDGRITCRSTPGKGTCFQIYLPAVEPVLEKRPADETRRCQGGNETILLVDDDENIRNTGKEGLENAGYTVRTASGGEMALNVYGQKAEKIHLVLLDLIMPGMGGARCLHELLQTDPGTKVVIISGYSPDDQTMQAIRSSTSGYLRKPYTGDQLLSTVREALDGGWPTRVPADSLSRPCQHPRS
jgi:two-component system, cell cycle sensor histidine kinase and response regulator CckA